MRKARKTNPLQWCVRSQNLEKSEGSFLTSRSWLALSANPEVYYVATMVTNSGSLGTPF